MAFCLITGFSALNVFQDHQPPSPAHPTVKISMRDAEPLQYWASGIGLGLVSVASLVTAVGSGVQIYRSTPAVQAQAHAATGRKAEALTRQQLRDVEAGAGPVPPWVRFPGSIKDIQEDQALDYFTKNFLPFWGPLTPEARTAYLVRNPPPNDEWRETVEEIGTEEGWQSA